MRDLGWLETSYDQLSETVSARATESSASVARQFLHDLPVNLR